MRLLKQTNPECLVYSTAMVLDVEPKEITDTLGHNGLEIWWPDLKGNSRFRGVHIQEIIDFVLSKNRALVPIDLWPTIAPNLEVESRTIYDNARKRFEYYIIGRRGILIGQNKSGAGHACAWSGKEVFDPNGSVYPLDQFHIQTIWLLI